MKAFSNSFHAHIYFTSETKILAQKLHAKIGENYARKLLHFGKLIERPIGPHPAPMFEIDFDNDQFTEIITFLMQNHEDLSVLIHPQTGNDLLDHTTHALWLGKQLNLKLETL